MVDLSVLVCSTHTRYDTFGMKIQDQLWPQLAALAPEDQDRVEVLMLTDNKRMMLGDKRNKLVDIAQGRYVAFVDDDDRLEPDYLSSLLEATAAGADVITFLVSVRLNGGAPTVCRYSKDFAADANTGSEYQRLPNHICAVKRSIALRCSFPNVVYGEDAGYSKLLKPLLTSEYAIDRVLYHYDYDALTTETQQHREAALRRRNQLPLVDVVMLSNATTVEKQRMTQRAVDSCIAGANGLAVNVVVLEQVPNVSYTETRTVEAPAEFHYNRFANKGASLGMAEWILVANNDLVFEDGWLHALLAADHPAVSPLNPGDPRQSGSELNEVGAVNGRHFSGWCFMVKRYLWELLGGFDECVSFWCSDDVVVEQLQGVGVLPMLVPAARVRHLGSKSLEDRADVDDLTWAQVDIFNRRFGRDKFAGDPRYEIWKVNHAG